MKAKWTRSVIAAILAIGGVAIPLFTVTNTVTVIIGSAMEGLGLVLIFWDKD